jgi:hypothetical protein
VYRPRTCCAPDLEDLHGLAGRDPQVLVVGQGGPDLAGGPDPAGRQPGDLLGDQAAGADELAVAERELGPAVQALDEGGADQREHGDGGDERGDDLGDHGKADQGGDHADGRAGGQHGEDQVQAEHLGHAERDRQRQPGLPEMVADPVHDQTLSSQC